MNIDSINLRDNILSEKLTRLLEGLNEVFFDPLIKVHCSIIIRLKVHFINKINFYLIV